MGLTNTKEAPQRSVTISESDVSKPTSIEFSKQILDFNLSDSGCPINEAVFDEVELTNRTLKKVKFKFDPVSPPSCQLAFMPMAGSLDKNKSKKIRVKLLLTDRVNVNFKITLRIQGGESLFINLRVSGEKGVFGVDPATLEQVEDNGYLVPRILVSLKERMIQSGGLGTEGIFRLGGEQTEIKRIKEALNKKNDFQTNDVNAIASLIKIWFRELPVPVLNAIPQTSIMSFHNESDCVEAYHSLPEPNKTLLDWLLDFMSQIVRNCAVNKMTAQNIAIVVAPNLYDINTPNPLEGLFLSQKCAAFLNHVLHAWLTNGN